MNPLVILVLLLVLRGGTPALSVTRLSLPTYFDTFRMEMMLDRMRTLTDALEKVNHLRQIDQTASGRTGTVERLGESLEVAKADALAACERAAGDRSDGRGNRHPAPVQRSLGADDGSGAIAYRPGRDGTGKGRKMTDFERK